MLERQPDIPKVIPSDLEALILFVPNYSLLIDLWTVVDLYDTTLAQNHYPRNVFSNTFTRCFQLYIDLLRPTV